MLHSPKNRTCPSLSCSSCWNMRRHAVGDTKGNKPSITSSRPSASQNASPESKRYFFAAADGNG
jgi:hypothetical protein